MILTTQQLLDAKVFIDQFTFINVFNPEIKETINEAIQILIEATAVDAQVALAAIEHLEYQNKPEPNSPNAIRIALIRRVIKKQSIQLSASKNMKEIIKRLIQWDKDYPVNSYNGYAGLKELDAIIADGKDAVSKFDKVQ